MQQPAAPRTPSPDYAQDALRIGCQALLVLIDHGITNRFDQDAVIEYARRAAEVDDMMRRITRTREADRASAAESPTDPGGSGAPSGR